MNDTDQGLLHTLQRHRRGCERRRSSQPLRLHSPDAEAVVQTTQPARQRLLTKPSQAQPPPPLTNPPRV